MENNDRTKCPTMHGNITRHTDIPTGQRNATTGQRRTPHKGRNRVSEIKKVLPEGGWVCTVGYPAPPAYFIKFETGVPFIHKIRYKSHG